VPIATTSSTAAFEEDKDDMPVVDNNMEYLVIGHPAEECHDIFVLSIVIESAHHMQTMVEKLLKKCTPHELQAILHGGFWLSYSLFDVVVQTDVFTSLENAIFPIIRDSFRLKSSTVHLAAFFQSTRTLPIFLCTVDRILARVEVPLTSFLHVEDRGGAMTGTHAASVTTASSPSSTTASSSSSSLLPSARPAFVSRLDGPFPFLPTHETKGTIVITCIRA
jgi:hypothetical protein